MTNSVCVSVRQCNPTPGPSPGIWCTVWSNWCKWSDSWLTSSTTLTACSLVLSCLPQTQVWWSLSDSLENVNNSVSAWFPFCFPVCSDGVGHFQRAPCRRGSLRSAVWRKRHERCSCHRAFLVSPIKPISANLIALPVVPDGGFTYVYVFLKPSSHLVLKFNTHVWDRAAELCTSPPLGRHTALCLPLLEDVQSPPSTDFFMTTYFISLS